MMCMSRGRVEERVWVGGERNQKNRYEYCGIVESKNKKSYIRINNIALWYKCDM